MLRDHGGSTTVGFPGRHVPAVQTGDPVPRPSGVGTRAVPRDGAPADDDRAEAELGVGA